jgi:hypothetical protein
MKLFRKCILKDLHSTELVEAKEVKIAKNSIFLRDTGYQPMRFTAQQIHGLLAHVTGRKQISSLSFAIFASLRSLRPYCIFSKIKGDTTLYIKGRVPFNGSYIKGRVPFNEARSPSRLLATILAAIFLIGCSTPPQKLGKWEGPTTPTQLTSSSTDIIPHGQLLRTPHYAIHTTLVNPDYRNRLAQVMEGAYSEYTNVVPGVPLSPRPMDCFIFQSRPEWNDFTRDNTGIDAKIYLQINRGGYTLHDWYVAYYIGDLATLSVASHEGWHQFVARNFKGRIPPFLEEGIATTFETIHFENDLPRWNRTVNPNRAQALRNALDARRLWPLDQLVSMHAGQIVDKSGDRIASFYAQAWAFARFLQDADNAKYRPAFQRLLRDTAAGSVEDPAGHHINLRLGWNPQLVQPILEHYLNLPWSEIDQRYQAYLRVITHEEFAAQFAS